jgi:hypothetical protein
MFGGNRMMFVDVSKITLGGTVLFPTLDVIVSDLNVF